MVVVVECDACGHVGVVADARWPRRLTCYSCGAVGMVNRHETRCIEGAAPAGNDDVRAFPPTNGSVRQQ
jgi:hypothetical protein